MRVWIFAAALASFAPSALAHEFWIAPSAFHLTTPGEVETAVSVGDGQAIERWNMRRQRVVSLRAFGPDGVVDQQANVRDGAESVSVSFDAPGAYVLALETNHAFLEMTPAEFNLYVEHEGLTPIHNDRLARSAQDQPGREMYSRRAKAFIRVGADDNAIFTRPIGMSLEIVPELSPFALASGQALPVRVYFHGEPLAGALVQLGSLDRPGEPMTSAITDAEGRAAFNFQHQGNWRLSVIWSELLERRERADYDTTFSSVTFGY